MQGSNYFAQQVMDKLNKRVENSDFDENKADEIRRAYISLNSVILSALKELRYEQMLNLSVDEKDLFFTGQGSKNATVSVDVATISFGSIKLSFYEQKASATGVAGTDIIITLTPVESFISPRYSPVPSEPKVFEEKYLLEHKEGDDVWILNILDKFGSPKAEETFDRDGFLRIVHFVFGDVL